MTINYPVKATTYFPVDDDKNPIGIGIFDHAGLWACHAPSGQIKLAVNQMPTAQAIAALVNDAYRTGRRDAQADMRAALGIDDNG